MIRIKKILLWSNDYKKREIELNHTGITVIIGNSQTGKSALIPIIDYCLASSECDIPTGTIRNHCSWYGIILELDNSNILIARKNPNGTSVSNDMYFSILENNELPQSIEKNITRSEVKNFFNEYFALTNLSIDENDYTKDYVPTYRDTIGINFYPQELLINKNYYFYKQEISIHDKHLRFMFPYFMGILSMQDVVNKKEYDNVLRMIVLLNRSNNKNQKVLSKWEIDSKEKILKAMELGITKLSKIPESFEGRITELKKIQNAVLTQKINTMKNSLNCMNDELSKLQTKESQLYSEVFYINKEIYKIKRQRDNIDGYNQDNINFQNNKMLTEWVLNDEYLQSEIVKSNDSYAKSIYYKILNNLKKEEQSIEFYSSLKVSLDKEYFVLKGKQNNLINELDYTRECISKFVEDSDDVKKNLNLLKDLYKFMGELDNYIKLYEIISNDLATENQLIDLNHKKNQLEALIDEKSFEDKYYNFDLYLKGTLETILDSLNVEYKGNDVWFDSKKIEFKFSYTKSGVPLSKIGSGSNYVEYHLAMAFLLHIYIQNCVKDKCTFDFMFIDQPSEAYFPTKGENKKKKTNTEKENDYIRLKQLYKTISNLKDAHAKNLQIIITEHADEEFWKNSENKFYSSNIKIINWKKSGEKLIPDEWLQKREGMK